MKTTKIWAVLLILTVSVSLFSCGGGEKPAEPRIAKGGVELGGELNLAITSLSESLSPVNMTNSETAFIGSMIHGTLLKNDRDGIGLVPEIAERWEIDESKTVIVFHLRKGMLFQPAGCLADSHREVMAMDVVSSFEKLCAPGNEGAFLKSFRGQINGAEAFHLGKTSNVAGLEVLDDYSVRITLKKPNGSFPFILTEPACAIVAYCEDGSSVGSGPFIAKVDGESLLLSAHSGYSIYDEFGNKLPYLNKVILSVIPTKQMELDAFFSGKLDVITNLYPDPIRKILDEHINEFSGNDAVYVMERNGNLASYDLYTLYRKGISGYSINFLDRADVTRVQLKSLN